LIVKAGGQASAVDKNESSFCAGVIRQVDLRFSPAPIILLIQSSHHLAWEEAFEGTELLLEIGHNLFV
jgi:hypothetical protein